MAQRRTFYDIMRSVPQGRWNGITRPFSPHDVLKLRGSLAVEHTLAERGALRLWHDLHNEPYINALGAMSGNQAMQMARAGLKAIYLSGWQIAADANTAGSMYPDQSLYPANSGPNLTRTINNAFARADQIEFSESEGKSTSRDWFLPIVADCEAGFGGPLNCFEIAKAYVEAGAAGIHFEDQLAAAKKCGHLGGKVLIPTSTHITHLNAARLATDVCGVPTVIVSRTDAESATLITNNVDERDRPFIDFEKGQTSEGFFFLKKGTGLEQCIQRGLSQCPYSDMLWMETSTPDLKVAKTFAEAIKKEYPDQLLSYNCSPSFNWAAKLSPTEIASFQKEIAAMGYTFQFVTLAGFHSLNLSMYKLAVEYKDEGMAAYSKLQQEEFAYQPKGYSAVRHQREVGTGYFDQIAKIASGGDSSTIALQDSTESAQFNTNVVCDHPPSVKSIEKLKIPFEPVRVPRASFSTAVGTEIPTINSAGSMEGMRADQQEEFLSNERKDIFSTENSKLLLDLHRKFDAKREELLQEREVRQQKINNGMLLEFNPETKDIRMDPAWQVDEIPKNLRNRRVEICAPANAKSIEMAQQSGAQVFMADFEDSFVPSWVNVVQGHKAMKDLIHSNADGPKVGFRPRGLHLNESHAEIEGAPVSAFLFDLSVYAGNTLGAFAKSGQVPHIYLPKLESFAEAQMANDILNQLEDSHNLQRGTIKATLLVEHIGAAFDAEEMCYALRSHLVGLSCGRWDYLFSHAKMFGNHPKLVLPNRTQVTLRAPFMAAYQRHTIDVGHKRGAYVLGPMSPHTPSANLTRNGYIKERLYQDKSAEYLMGHDGTWVAAPAMVGVAQTAYQRLGSVGNQIRRAQTTTSASPPAPTSEALLLPPVGSFSASCLRGNIRAVQNYYAAWLGGNGWVPLNGVMEEAATAEISRTQIWQWANNRVQLDDGRDVTLDLVKSFVDFELKLALEKSGNEGVEAERLNIVADILLESSSAKDCPQFMTQRLYQQLLADGR